MKVSFFFAWYDFWIGFFWDRQKKILYICPLPCCVIKLERKPRAFTQKELEEKVQADIKELASMSLKDKMTIINNFEQTEISLTKDGWVAGGYVKKGTKYPIQEDK